MHLMVHVGVDIQHFINKKGHFPRAIFWTQACEGLPT